MKWIVTGEYRYPKYGEWYCGNGDMPRQAQSDTHAWPRLILTPIADGSIVVPPETVEPLRFLLRNHICLAKACDCDWCRIIGKILALAEPPKSARLIELEKARELADCATYAKLIVPLIDAEIEREKAKAQ